MSHVTTTEIEGLTEIEVLREACESEGLQFREGQRSYQWYGRWVDDSPIPDGLFSAEETARLRALPKAERQRIMTERLGKCEHAVSVPGSSYEIGVVKKADGSGYNLVWDYFGSKITGKLGGRSAPVLRRAYNTAKTKRALKRRGYRILSEERLHDGNVKLKVTR